MILSKGDNSHSLSTAEIHVVYRLAWGEEGSGRKQNYEVPFLYCCKDLQGSNPVRKEFDLENLGNKYCRGGKSFSFFRRDESWPRKLR